MADVFHPHRLLEEQGPLGRHVGHVLDHVHHRVLVPFGLVLVIGPGRTDDGVAALVGEFDPFHRGEPLALKIVVDGHRIVPVIGHRLARVDQLDADE